MSKRRRPRCGRHQFTTETKRNQLFEQYYKGQSIVPESEWEAFMNALGQELPITFRVTGFREQNRHLLRFIQDSYKADIEKMPFPVGENGEKKPTSFKPIQWYPDSMAWQLDTDKYVVRKTPELKALHQFLVSEMESGKISRQEAVSMLPPLLMDVKAHHTVLDLCAAPGSKSAQLVELLHADAEHALLSSKQPDSDDNNYEEPSGLLIANDVDQKRCYMMVHQIKRLQSPCTIVTQEDAACFPKLYSSIFAENEGSTTQPTQLFFDRILADVPCSGDATLRKNPDIWLRWTPNLGIGEHFLQCRILRRGLELLRDPSSRSPEQFARLVYSTCSFNPLEDEAVVASLLNACQGTVRLVEPERLGCVTRSSDASGQGKFKVRPGLTTWRVMNKKGHWFERFEDVPQSQQSIIRPSMFPPNNASDLHLDRCMRVLPHDQNTGGFFIAVLEKIAPLPWVKQSRPSTKVEPVSVTDRTKSEAVITNVVSPSTEETSDMVKENETNAKRALEPSDAPVEGNKKPRILNENPFTYIDPATDEDWPKVRDYYGIVEESRGNRYVSGRLFCPSNLLYRSSGEEARRRQFYYTNHYVKDLILHNACRGLKLINCGVRMFALMEDKQFTGYRLLQDGVELADAFLPATGGRRILLTEQQYADLVLLLEEEMPLLSRFTEATQAQCASLSPGPSLIEYRPMHKSAPTGDDRAPRCRIVFAGWRGIKSLRHYIGHHERYHLMRLANLEPKPVISGRTPVPDMAAEDQNGSCSENDDDQLKPELDQDDSAIKPELT